MVILKKIGYTNKQIEDLVAQAWSENTIKLFTRDTNAGDKTLKKNAEKIIADMASMGINLNQSDMAVSLTDNLESTGLGIEDIYLLQMRSKNLTSI